MKREQIIEMNCETRGLKICGEIMYQTREEANEYADAILTLEQKESKSAEEILESLHNIERMSANMEDSYVLKRTALRAMEEYRQQPQKESCPIDTEKGCPYLFSHSTDCRNCEFKPRPSIWRQIWKLIIFLIHYRKPDQEPQKETEVQHKEAIDPLKVAKDNAELLLSIYITELRKRGHPERRIRRIVKKKFNIVVK